MAAPESANNLVKNYGNIAGVGLGEGQQSPYVRGQKMPSLMPIAYPEWLETWWVARACRALGHPDPAVALPRLTGAAQALADLFTTERPRRFGNYQAQAAQVLAYGLLYFPQVFARTGWVMAELLDGPRRWQPPTGRPLRVADLGAGLGAAGLGLAASLLARGAAVDLLALDHAAEPLGLLRQLVDEAHAGPWPGLRLRTVVGDLRSWQRAPGTALPPQAEGWDAIVVSFALNEAMAEAAPDAYARWLETALARLAPGGLLIVLEPATRLATTALHTARDALLATQQGHVWAPCPHARPCPLLAEGKAWCHEVRHSPPPASAALLNRQLHHSLAELKWSFLVLGRRPPTSAASATPPGPDRFRLVAPLAPIKGAYITRGCAADGALYTYEVPTRHLTDADHAAAEALGRGDLAELPPAALAPMKEAHRYRCATVPKAKSGKG